MGEENTLLTSSLQTANPKYFQELTLVFCFFPFCRNMAVDYFMHEKIWFDKYKYDDAERRYYEQMNGPLGSSSHQQVTLVLRRGLAECWSFKSWYRVGKRT